MGEMSQEEMLEQQKENCIFCKIVAGEMDSKKIFQDEQMEAILDINPAAKGHILVMLKEHYPIMPLIPPEEFSHLFGRAAPLSTAVREAVLAQHCTVFIANGAIAGQQSPHFLFHIIPREDGDALPLEIPKNGVNQSDIHSLLKDNLLSVMRQHLTKTGQVNLLNVGEAVAEATPELPPPLEVSEPPEVEKDTQPVPSMNQLAQLIESNPELKEIILNNPDKLQGILEQNPQFKNLFAGVDIQKLSEQLRVTQDAPQESEVKPARAMTMEELFAYIESKPKLSELILNDPDKLKELLTSNLRLQQFFAGSSVDMIINAYKEHVEAKSGSTL